MNQKARFPYRLLHTEADKQYQRSGWLIYNPSVYLLPLAFQHFTVSVPTLKTDTLLSCICTTFWHRPSQLSKQQRFFSLQLRADCGCCNLILLIIPAAVALQLHIPQLILVFTKDDTLKNQKPSSNRPLI